MTNYEKYKEEIIDILVRENTCIRIAQLRYDKLKCKNQTCKECMNEQKQWLEAEAKEFDPAELRTGDKIKMRKRGSTEFSEVQVFCNLFPIFWMRPLDYENHKPKSDKDFLISYDKLMSEYDVIEVFRE